MDETATRSGGQTTAGVAANAETKATSVNLLIKSSNQQYDDQIIESDMLWSIQRLKMHLASTHPCKPPVAEQKLIYSGQLLNDKCLLKEVLRSYKDVYTQNHIIHLVYTPRTSTYQVPKVDASKKAKQQVTANMAATTSGASSILRQRHVGMSEQQEQQQNSSETQQQQQQPQFSNFAAQFVPQMSGAAVGSAVCPPYYVQNFMPLHMQFMATQQNAVQVWMQQVYEQYMDQYARLSTANGVNGDNATAAAAIAAATPTSPWPANPFVTHLPPYALNAGNMPYPVIPPPTLLSATATNMQSAQTSDASNAAVNTGNGAAPVAADDVAEEPRAHAEPAAEPRFPLIGQEDMDGRDWLDSFFSITRLAIFLTIMYFNSSPMRCLAVVIIASFIYFYHIGVLRFNRERNNNNINRNNNAEAAAQNVRANNNANDNANANANLAAEQRAEGADDENSSTNGDDEEQHNETANSVSAPASNSLMATVQTFVITFFTSLLPETPTVN